MGMFDYVKVDVPLPDGWEPGELQSKDFDCEMTTLHLREDGTLWVERFETEVVPEEERPYPGAKGIKGLVGMMRRVNRRWEPIAHHGWFNFYGHERIKARANPPYFEPDEHKWHEYDAKFTDGKLVEIKMATA